MSAWKAEGSDLSFVAPGRMRRALSSIPKVAWFLAVAAFLSSECQAVSFSILHSFGNAHCQGTSADGVGPSSVAFGTDGLLYGVTYIGGAENGLAGGSIYTIDPTTGVLQTRFAFPWGLAPNEGSSANGPLLRLTDGSFYGTTTFGGAVESGWGTVFKYIPPDHHSIIHSFPPPFDPTNYTTNSEGLAPDSGVVTTEDGSIWGVTPRGGVNDNGTVYQLDPSTGTLTQIHVFSGSGSLDANDQPNDDGANPIGQLLAASDGKIYGVTRQGGHGNNGTIYSIDPKTSAFTVLHHFDAYSDITGHNSDGSDASAGVIEGRDGSFYGVTCYGGTNAAGTAFRFDRSTSKLTTLVPFQSSQRCPSGRLLQASDGNLYGTTTGDNAAPVIFRLSLTGTLTTLYTFDEPFQDPLGCHVYINEDGMLANGDLVTDGKGNLFGTARGGGLGNSGTVFELQGAIPQSDGGGTSAVSGSKSGGGGEVDGGSLLLLAALLVLHARRGFVGGGRGTFSFAPRPLRTYPSHATRGQVT
jgi:uncharacterized repeat protein (TIGR03803 family)